MVAHAPRCPDCGKDAAASYHPYPDEHIRVYCCYCLPVRAKFVVPTDPLFRGLKTFITDDNLEDIMAMRFSDRN